MGKNTERTERMQYDDKSHVQVDERKDGSVWVSAGHYMVGPGRWNDTVEALHNMLARLGYRRSRKQKDSLIGGEYDK
jgi:hypothetical protein